MTTAVTEAEMRDQIDWVLISEISGHEEPVSSWEFDVIDDPERGRWIAALGADAIGELTYREVGGRIVLIKTWVDHAYRGKGVASELISRVLREIQATGKKITIICRVVGEFIAAHPKYADLIDEKHPGSGAGPALSTGTDEELRAFENDMS